jgi:hypothetical protein
MHKWKKAQLKCLRNKCIFFSNYSVHILYILTFVTYYLLFKGAHFIRGPLAIGQADTLASPPLLVFCSFEA